MNNALPLLQALQMAGQQGTQTPMYGVQPTLAQFAANSGMSVPRQMSPWANVPWAQLFANAMRQRGRPQPAPQSPQQQPLPVQAQAQPADFGGSGWNTGFAGPAAGPSQVPRPQPDRMKPNRFGTYAPVQTFTPVGATGAALPTQAVAQPGVVSAGRNSWGF